MGPHSGNPRWDGDSAKLPEMPGSPINQHRPPPCCCCGRHHRAQIKQTWIKESQRRRRRKEGPPRRLEVAGKTRHPPYKALRAEGLCFIPFLQISPSWRFLREEMVTRSTQQQRNGVIAELALDFRLKGGKMPRFTAE